MAGVTSIRRISMIRCLRPLYRDTKFGNVSIHFGTAHAYLLSTSLTDADTNKPENHACRGGGWDTCDQEKGSRAGFRARVGGDGNAAGCSPRDPTATRGAS
ncbi:uncharacterized protein LOC116846723 [Odontomachus brunneus]|uniref:uncharacterized protein LOC116846723 n=1 Tax=Odontomachus brunneus TaxID=486640 RepID=UPI0013F2265C|nr:uncharacterized protein LOC116846723 [Odontomachus brunneus]